MATKSTKRKRTVSAAQRERLRELRRKHGLGEFSSGDPFRGRRGKRGKSKARRTSGRAASSYAAVDRAIYRARQASYGFESGLGL